MRIVYCFSALLCAFSHFNGVLLCTTYIRIVINIIIIGDLFSTSIFVELAVGLLEVQVQIGHLADDGLLLQRVLVNDEQQAVDVFLHHTRAHTHFI